MPALWKGAIGFGLVSVPVRLVPATQEHGIRLHQVHDADGGRIRQERVCDLCGQTIPYEHVARAAEAEGRQAVLTEAEMERLPLPTKKLIDVLAFIDAARIDPIQLSRPYYLAPDSPAADKPYVLLRETMRRTDRVAVTKIALRTRESLALMRVHDDLLALHTLYWPDEIRSPAGLAPADEATVRPQEIAIAASLMDRMSPDDFDVDTLEDAYQQALEEAVFAKLTHRPAPRRAATPAPAEVADLMAALQASIDREDTGSGRPARARKASAPAAKTSAAKAPPAKRQRRKS
ncbi:non-homologous end joining protein Ku [Streptomyces klenkii]